MQAGSLIVIDSLHSLLSISTPLPSLLFPLLTPKSSLLGIYHTSVPPPHQSALPSFSPYAPDPLTLLTYLATTILRVHSIQQTLARHRAAAKSLPEPVFGLQEEKEGVLVGRGANPKGGELVVEMEHRRKSGRAVEHTFVLSAKAQQEIQAATRIVGESKAGMVTLLPDHPLFKQVHSLGESRGSSAKADMAEGEEGEHKTTFNLELTERQKLAREGVVLPYLDAQKGEGPGEGGRILYQMGTEDDFDEEEDEI